MDKAEWGVGSKAGAVGGFLKQFLPLVIIPLIILKVLDAVMDNTFIEGSTDPYKEMVNLLIIFSIPLLLLAIPKGYYAKGNSARIPFAFIFPIYSIAWIWLFTNGGLLPVSLPEMDIGALTISSAEMVLDLSILLYIMMAIGILKGLMAFTEYSKYREKFQEKLKKGSL